MTDSAGVTIQDLTKTYYPSPGWMKLLVRSNIKEPVYALKGIDLEVGPGQICAVVGPNGAGKTTTFRILIGLTSSTSGSARVMGRDCGKESIEVRKLVGWMPAEDRSLIMRLSCAENLYFHGRLNGMSGQNLKDRIRDSLAIVGIAHAAESSVFALSAGMRARLQLARALLHDPKVLILDEPTGSVDPVASHELLNLIIETVEKRELACLISSHRLEEIEALHSHAILLDRGQIRYDGDLDTLRVELERPSIEIEFTSLEDAQKAAQIVKGPGLGEAVGVDGNLLHFVLLPGVTVGRILVALERFTDQMLHFREVQTPLRDLLAEMYAREKDDGEEEAAS